MTRWRTWIVDGSLSLPQQNNEVQCAVEADDHKMLIYCFNLFLFLQAYSMLNSP